MKPMLALVVDGFSSPHEARLVVGRYAGRSVGTLKEILYAIPYPVEMSSVGAYYLLTCLFIFGGCAVSSYPRGNV